MTFDSGSPSRVVRTQWSVLLQRVAELLPERPLRTDYFGQPFYYPSASIIGRAIAKGAVWDAPLLDALSHARPGSAFVDIGANIGATCRGVMHTRPDLQVVAVEPSERFLPFLRKNLLDFGGKGSSAAQIRTLLVGPEGAKIDIAADATTASAVEIERRQRRKASHQEVTATSLDGVLSSVGDCSIIKIDVDGYEGWVILSGERALSTLRPVLYLEWTPSLHEKAGCDTEEVAAVLGRCGYEEALVFYPGHQHVQRATLAELEVPHRSYVDLLLMPSL